MRRRTRGPRAQQRDLVASHDHEARRKAREHAPEEERRSSARSSRNRAIANQARLRICPVCWMRQAAEPPKAKTSAATSAPGLPAAVAEKDHQRQPAGPSMPKAIASPPRTPGRARIARPADRAARRSATAGRRSAEGPRRHRGSRTAIPRCRRREELELRLEMRLGVPGDGERAREPGPESRNERRPEKRERPEHSPAVVRRSS